MLSCTRIDPPPTEKGDTLRLPVAEYRDTTIIDMYEGSHLSWIMKTTHLVKWPNSDLVHARPVHLTVFDSLKQPVIWVKADSGAVDEAVSLLLASGNVHARSEKGVEITSDSLRWNKSANRITTESRVKVISEEGDVLTGRGFVSDADLDNWQILSDVKGVFHQVEDRIKKEGERALPDSASLPADAQKQNVDSASDEPAPLAVPDTSSRPEESR